MFNWLKEKALKLLAGTWLNKAIRDGLLVVATFLLASDYSICVDTSICKDLASLLGENTEIIVNKVVEIVFFLIAAIMKIKAAKPEIVGKKVLKGS
jgi:hypothetical protein